MRALKGIILLALPFAAYAQATKPQPVSNQDGVAVFAHSDVCKYTRTVEGVAYGEAWNQGSAPGEEEFLGYVFRKPFALAGPEAYLLVGVNKDGTIARVRAKNTELIDGEFLAQFEGKNSSASWEIARTLEDLLFVPARIKAIRGQAGISENLTREVKEMLQAAAQLPKSD